MANVSRSSSLDDDPHQKRSEKSNSDISLSQKQEFKASPSHDVPYFPRLGNSPLRNLTPRTLYSPHPKDQQALYTPHPNTIHRIVPMTSSEPPIENCFCTTAVVVRVALGLSVLANFFLVLVVLGVLKIST